jgi:leucyl aminopeptidase
VTTFSYSTAATGTVPADVLVLPIFEGPEPGPGLADLKGVDLLTRYEDAKLTGKRGETLFVSTAGVEGLAASAVLLLGVGRRSEASPDSLRRAIGLAAPQLLKYTRVATTMARSGGRNPEEAAQALVEGLLLGSYRFDRYKTKPADAQALETVVVLGSARWDARAVRAALNRGQVLSESTMWARDLVNTPARDMTPADLAEAARAMADQVGLEVTIWDEKELEAGGFGGILGVGQGSVNPPRLIELAYRGAAASQRPIALTGKGISFDSGGLSIKTSEGMEWMKGDMGGAASILGAMRSIALLKPKVNVIAAIPSAENMPSGAATRPGDVLRHRGGKTSEVLNTDAEGRLVLADALAYLAEKDPRAIVDTATLTGACMVALGDQVWGVFSNDGGLARDLVAAGDASGEPGWELPLHEPYRKLIDSQIADVKNLGKRYGGAITAALFLAEFVGDTPWAHMDIAGPAFASKRGDYTPKGGTGVPVRTLVRYVLAQAPKPQRRRSERPR